MQKFKPILILLAILLTFTSIFLSFKLFTQNQKKAEILTPLASLPENAGAVLNSSTQSALALPPGGSLSASTSAKPKISSVSGSIKIAFLGDSMVDTFLIKPEFLKSELGKGYPKVNFEILNYGVGATNAQYGLKRLTENYTYLEKTYPGLLSQNPDIIVVESFSYNHPKELAENRNTLSQIISKVQSQSKAKILMMVTIAPDKKIYAKGIEGINWDQKQREIEATRVMDFLKDTVSFAQGQNLPIINAYQKSLDWEGDGNQILISNDNIHPSDAGRILLAQVTVEKLYQAKMVENILD